MKNNFIILVIAIAIFGFGCAQNPIKSNYFCGDNCVEDFEATEQAKNAMIVQEAEQSINMGLAYNRQEAYKKGAGFFIQAAEMYGVAGEHEKQRQAVVAAAKTQLKISDRSGFLISATQLTGLIDRYEMPSETEQLLLNLAANMENKDLPFPIKPEQRIIFNR